jgi:hypothetical protein
MALDRSLVTLDLNVTVVDSRDQTERVPVFP